MTVPGKGGRPRKWRSDADRQRAWRARQQGDAEPPTLVVALDEGDELAKAWETIRDLGEQLEAAKDKTHRLQVELNRERRERATEDRRWGWITTMNDQLTNDNQRIRDERDEALYQARDFEIRLQQAVRTRATLKRRPARCCRGPNAADSNASNAANPADEGGGFYTNQVPELVPHQLPTTRNLPGSSLTSSPS